VIRFARHAAAFNWAHIVQSCMLTAKNLMMWQQRHTLAIEVNALAAKLFRPPQITNDPRRAGRR
jgi:hypothetical protein